MEAFAWMQKVITAKEMKSKVKNVVQWPLDDLSEIKCTARNYIQLHHSISVSLDSWKLCNPS